MDITLVYALGAFVWGALWGSFLNVVVHRLPRGESLAMPGSHCPSCSRPIPWYENIPLLSYVVLRARCRGCGSSIAARYVVLEFVTAALSMALFLKVSVTADLAIQLGDVLIVYLFYFVFLCAVIAVAAIDLELTLIPDAITIPTAVMGVVSAIVIPLTTALPGVHPQVTWLDSVLGLVGSVAFLGLIFWGYKLVTGRIGLGGGDFTLIAMLGAYLGWVSLPFVLFLASVQGLLYAVGAALGEKCLGRRILLRGVHRPEFWDTEAIASGEAPPERSDPEDERFGRMGIPFGPFLGLAGMEYLFFGDLFEALMYGGL